jgi:phosphatidylserine/phosphatidylglycerophosphate/cardiolipin synthase-like enzyme
VKVEIFGGKVHHKFAVIDVNGANPVVVTGSYNWTAAGEEQNDENTLIIYDPAVAQAYYQEYLKLYQALPAETVCANISAESGLAACQDGSDNDYDGYVDGADFNCQESTMAACSDMVDNDGDGKVDLEDLDCYMMQFVLDNKIYLPLIVK